MFSATQRRPFLSQCKVILKGDFMPLHFLHRALGLMMALTVPWLAQAESGKLLLTGGVSSIEGAAGGGLTPWATTGSYAATGEIGGTAFVTGVHARNYSLSTVGAAVSIHDRFELSLAHQNFNTKHNLTPLGLDGLHLKQDIVGLKVRVAGDAVLDSDTPMPQLALGLQYKKTSVGGLAPTLFGPLGARSSGTDFYFSATKLLLGQGVLLNATLRATKANQSGLLGFGGANKKSYQLQPEISIVKLLSSSLVVGVEYRAKPDNLQKSVLGDGALKEDDWHDVFLAWAPNKNFSLTLAYVNLGRIVPALQPKRQTGAYVSAQVAF
jgi:hypothetical protein